MTTPVEGTWTPVSEYDNFNAPALTNPNPDFTYPDYALKGVEPAATGIPSTNPAYAMVKLGRVVAQGSDVNTWMVRTYEGWLLDLVYPHAGYSLGDFILLLVIGQWVTDLGQRVYLPPVPVTPADVPVV